MNRITKFLASVVVGAAAMAQAQPDDQAIVSQYITRDVVGVGYVDLRRIEIPAVLEQLRQTGWDKTLPAEPLPAHVTAAQDWIRHLRDHGAVRVYALLQTAQLMDSGPAWVLELAPDANTSEIVEWLPDASAMPGWPAKYRVVDKAVLGAATDVRLNQISIRKATNQRPEVVAALASLDKADMGILVWGDADSRRVVRELFPTLPAPFAAIDGALVADDVVWCGGLVRTSPQLELSVRIDTREPRAARAVQHAGEQLLELLAQWLGQQNGAADQPATQEPRLKAFRPTVQGTSVRLILGDDPRDLAELATLVAPLIGHTQQAAYRNNRINQFKQLALAMLNHESREGSLPTQAIVDDQGKALLSWRVQLLPYLGEDELYEQFRLDEAWDSPHNRQLIPRLPAVFVDPDPRLRAAIGEGRTTFVVPVAEETLFPTTAALPDGKPLELKQIIDGTSNTIAFVEVMPEAAVIWTKPEDWKVALDDDPRRGVVSDTRAGFVAAFCDGSVQFLSNDTAAEQLRAMLTRAGKD